MTKPNTIKSIKSLTSNRKMYKKFNIKCDKVNFIIGSNGSGKTRLFNQIERQLKLGRKAYFSQIELNPTKKDEDFTKKILNVSNIGIEWNPDIMEDNTELDQADSIADLIHIEGNRSTAIMELCYKLYQISVAKPDILLWEHPETGLHLDIQRDLIDYIKIVHPDIKQIFITTHSPEIVGSLMEHERIIISLGAIIDVEQEGDTE